MMVRAIGDTMWATFVAPVTVYDGAWGLTAEQLAREIEGQTAPVLSSPRPMVEGETVSMDFRVVTKRIPDVPTVHYSSSRKQRVPARAMQLVQVTGVHVDRIIA